jgi:hypothetical protein
VVVVVGGEGEGGHGVITTSLFFGREPFFAVAVV